MVPAEAWLRLPEDDDGLHEAAANCYGAAELLPLAGSQVAIQALPQLFAPTAVAALQPSYAEHRHHWQRAGHAVEAFAAEALEEVASRAGVVVLCNPNNPDGTGFAPARLRAAAAALLQHGGTRVVDDAFIDATPEQSVIADAGTAAPNLVVLRSLGKFYGLAGARVGFVAAAAPLRERLRELAGPWALAGPARWVARQALADRAWQTATAERLRSDGTRLAALLGRHFAGVVANPLFAWVPTADATTLADRLARRGILLRHFSPPDAAGLRCGLPADEAQWQRLASALETLK